MEEDRRRFQPLKIASCHVETGRARFMTERGWQPPETHWWRNNLTALSQRYNLYFLATGASIVVYRPSFPCQTLGDTPILSIPPSLANPSAPGYLDRGHQRHGINQILIGELGSEEILLACTDSGNVAAYHTRQVEKAVRRSQPGSTTTSANYFRVRPFFIHWVRQSAWGLAIHKQSRKIAVSANRPGGFNNERTASVTVFAFALSSRDEDGGDSADADPEVDGNAGWQLWTPRPREMVTPSRSINYKIVLSGAGGHTTNIPNISFIDTSQDPNGNWLISTDIEGEMKAWNIWSGKCWRSWNVAEARFAEGRGLAKHGWHVAALDPLAFRIAESRQEFCGWFGSPIYHGHRDGKMSYDLTNIVRDRIPGTSTEFATARPNARSGMEADFHYWPEDEQPENGSGGVSATSSPDSSARSSETLLISVETERPHRLDHDIEGTDGEMIETEEDYENEEYLEESSDDDSDAASEEQDVIWMDDEENVAESNPSMTPLSDIGGGMQLDEPGNDLEMRDTHEMPGSFPQPENSPRNLVKHSKSMEKVYQRAEERAVQQASDRPPAVPILHCSAAHIRLFSSLASNSAHVFCAHLLHQELPPTPLEDHFSGLKRLNMIHQIPELGVVVLTSQIGRVAICTLTRAGQEGDFGLRVDWVLPFQKQEADGHRPLVPLLGTAVGPIQGRMQPREKETVSTTDEPDDRSDEIHPEGIRTSFEEEVVILNGRRISELMMAKSPQLAAETRILRHRSASPSSKRKRALTPDSDSDDREYLMTERRAWETESKSEEWRGVENSRRYRLMLTYLDHTVLTYEIWREASELGIALGNEAPRKNLRNRDPV